MLKGDPFNLPLSDAQIADLTVWYRHKLAHTGTTEVNTRLSAARHGEPFDIDQVSKALTLIRVSVLYRVVQSAWDTCMKNFESASSDEACA